MASEANRQQRINEAEGQAAAIRAVAAATAEGIQQVASAIRKDGGMEAVQLRVAEQYVTQFGQIAQKTNTVVIPANLSDVSGMIAAAMKVFGATSTPQR
jgi:regulator of protease activity HflC (stomatin/prohibitin superfamily)